MPVKGWRKKNKITANVKEYMHNYHKMRRLMGQCACCGKPAVIIRYLHEGKVIGERIAYRCPDHWVGGREKITNGGRENGQAKNVPHHISIKRY